VESSLLNTIRKGLGFTVSPVYKSEKREKLLKHVRNIVADHMSLLAAFPGRKKNFLIINYLINLQRNLKQISSNRSLNQSIKFTPSFTDGMISVFDKDIHKSRPTYLKYFEEFTVKTENFTSALMEEDGYKLKNDTIIRLSEVLLLLLGNSRVNIRQKIETLIIRSKAFNYKGNYKDSLTCLKKALHFDNSFEDDKYYPSILISQANIYADQGNYDRAKQNFVQALSHYHKTGQAGGKLQLLMQLADLDIKFSFFDQSVKKLTICEELQKDNTDNNEQTKIYIGLAAAYLNIGNHNLSLTYFRKAELLAAAPSDNTAFVQAFISYGNLLHYSNADTFVKYFDMFMMFAEHSDDPKMRVSVFEKMGLYHLIKDNFSKAEFFFKKALILAQEGGNPYTIAEQYSYLAKCNIYTNKITDALHYISKSLKIFTQLKLDYKIAEQLVLQGIAHYSRNEYHRAIRLIRKALQISSKIGDIQGQTHSFVNLGVVYFLMGDYRKSVYAYRKQIETYLKRNYVKGLCISYNNMAESFMKLEKFRGAIININKALDYAEAMKSRYYICLLLNTKAEIYLSLDKLAKARTISEEALNIAREIKNDIAVAKIENTIKEIAISSR